MKKSNEIPETGRLHRLHPISLVFFMFKAAKDLIYPLLVFLLSTVFRGNLNVGWTVTAVGLFALLLFGIGLLNWLRYGYRAENGSLRVEHGIWVRKKIWISRDRVQAVNTSAGLMHRSLSLLKLQVETAGGKKPEVVLTAITAEEAEHIRAELLGAKPVDAASPSVVEDNDADAQVDVVTQPSLAGSTTVFPQPTTSQETTAHQGTSPPPERIVMRLKDLLIYSLTSGQIGIVLAVVGALFSQSNKFLKDIDLWGLLSNSLGPYWMIWAAAMLLLLTWLIAFVSTLLTEYGFSVTLTEEKLVIERGLLERKQVTIGLERIQAIHLVENVLRKPFGLVSIRVVTAGYGGKEGQTGLLFPIVPIREVPAFLSRFSPQFSLPVEDWNRLERRALRNYMLLPVTIMLLVAVPAIIWVPGQWGWLALLLPLLTAYSCWLNFHAAGWSVSGQQVAVRYGGLSRQIALIPKRRVQWHEVTQSPFQFRRRLASIKIALTSGGDKAVFHVYHMPVEAARKLSDWMTARK